ncbi:chromosome 1 open reading frame 53 [Plakobranchus ocellatus]|uniref:Chromosome 1 open reading frame 53 n=1 Tax=Plakobranchus ocellatus TaxID=259542 RepID=A0AAV4CUA8_9GAST|nr:chromosome 1 open reading frame 53 [Plakobranchus ocellatus]
MSDSKFPTNPDHDGTRETDLSVDIPDSKLFRFTKFVNIEDLGAEEKVIHSKHLKALQEGKELYKDPTTGYDVLTRLAHLRRGECCGNACRHCPYGHQKVPKNIPRKRFNSAFYVPV